MNKFIILISMMFLLSCGEKNMPTTPSTDTKIPSFWDNATVYFLLTDRFNNADVSNDFTHPSTPAPYRGYMGGDVKGITKKIEEGYFDSLGVTAIWMTPLVENITSGTDEGTGLSYGFHGYWTKDWTSFDSRVGTKSEIAEMVSTAHKHGIKIVMDAVINHTGPVTPLDTQWPDAWVRTTPKCTYTSYETTTACTLVENLPDIRTESTQEVELPPFLVEKWKAEGRYDTEMAELDTFFKRTNYPRRPYYYIVKWLTDMIRDFGIDGFRVDTAKHTEEDVWKTLYTEANTAFAEWKTGHPEAVGMEEKFYMVGEVYNYFVGNGRAYDFGDKKVDYFDYGFHALINFDFKGDATKSYDSLFTKYDQVLHGPIVGKSVLNYISSHDDGGPYDKERKKPFESATKLLLTQGGAQIYYGDETARSLSVAAEGDAVLRSFMNWEDISNQPTKDILTHWQKLGRFRKHHIAIGAGRHHKISDSPYTFARTYDANSYKDMVVCGVDMPKGPKTINTSGYFADGSIVKDYYSGNIVTVLDGKVNVDTPFDIVLLEIVE